MEGVRGRDKNQGAFRGKQYRIGRVGCSIDQASFVPIPRVHLPEGFDRWSGHLRKRDEPDSLTQLAIVHLEFEAPIPSRTAMAASVASVTNGRCRVDRTSA